MKNLKLVGMIEAAFFAAFAFILDLLPSIQLAPWITISFAMVPIFILAFRWGLKVSLLSGFMWGLLQVVLGNAYYLSPIQFLIEYFIAFAFVGFAGLFYKTIQLHFQNGNKKKALLWVVIATFVGSAARYFWHFVAGVVFWGEYAPEGMSPVIYSLIVNGVSMVGSFIFCSVVLIFLLAGGSRIIRRKELKLTKPERVL